ncbi:MAG: PriCT-2 domain-containing protein [Candidatus Scalindua sp.]
MAGARGCAVFCILTFFSIKTCHWKSTGYYSALRYIPADERETWVRVGMVLKSELGDSGYSLWDYCTATYL